MFSKKAQKIDKIFTFDLTLSNVWCIKNQTKLSRVLLLWLVWFLMHQMLVNVKLTIKISSIFLAFLENTNFKKHFLITDLWAKIDHCPQNSTTYITGSHGQKSLKWKECTKNLRAPKTEKIWFCVWRDLIKKWNASYTTCWLQIL